MRYNICLKSDSYGLLAISLILFVLPVNIVVYIIYFVEIRKSEKESHISGEKDSLFSIVKKTKIQYFIVLAVIILGIALCKPIGTSSTPAYDMTGTWYQANPDTPSTQVYTVYTFEDNYKCSVEENIGFMGPRDCTYRTDGKNLYNNYL